MVYSPPTSNWQRDDLPQREGDIIGFVVRDFLRTREPHPDLAMEDLNQECLIHWGLHRPKYDEDRGASLDTFLRRVVKAKLSDLEKAIKAQKRGRGRRADSPGSTAS